MRFIYKLVALSSQTFARQFPPDWLSLNESVPEIQPHELDQIQSIIKEKNAQLEAFEKNYTRTSKQGLTEDAKTIGLHIKFMNVMTVAQQYAKLSQYYFKCKNAIQGRLYFNLSLNAYDESLTSEFSKTVRDAHQVSLKTKQGKHLDSPEQYLTTVYSEFVALLKMRIGLSTEAPADSFFYQKLHQVCTQALITEPNFLKFQLLKLGALAFLATKLPHILEEIDKYQSGWLPGSFEFIRLGDFRNSILAPTPIEAIPWQNPQEQAKRFYSHLFLREVYDRFQNPDITRFERSYLPTDLNREAPIAYSGINISLSIGQTYRFLAHFRNITSDYEFATQSSVNRAIKQALFEKGLSDQYGFLTLKTHEDKLKVRSIMANAYKQLEPTTFNQTKFLETLSIPKILERQQKHQHWLRAAYDGFPPDLAVSMTGICLSNHPSAHLGESRLKAQLETSLHQAYGFRKATQDIIIANPNALPQDFEGIASQHIDQFLSSNQAVCLIQASIPSSDVRHSLFVVVKKESAGISIFLCDGAPKDPRYDGFIRDIEGEKQSAVLGFGPFEPSSSHINLLKKYVTRLSFESVRPKQILDQFYTDTSYLYAPFKGHSIFELKPMGFQHLVQVVGNCTLFGLQLGLGVGFNLSPKEKLQIEAELLVGIDALASQIRHSQIVFERSDSPSVFWENEEKKYSIGYDSGPRVKRPKDHTTGTYTASDGASVAGTQHHILPASYLQYLFEGGCGEPGLYASNPGLIKQLLGRPSTDKNPVALSKFVYGGFNLFKGPEGALRSDDPAKVDTDPNHGSESKKPSTLPQGRWDALEAIDKLLHPWLSRSPSDWSKTEHENVLKDCVPHLQKIAADPTYLQVHEEAVPGNDWIKDATTGEWRLK